MHQKWLEVAASQCGVITSSQLRDAGVTQWGRDSLLAEGALRRVGRQVFVSVSSDFFEPWEQDLWIAVLRAGAGAGAGPGVGAGAAAGAVACRRAAAAWWSLDGCGKGVVEVALRPGHQSRLAVAHRPKVLPPDHVTTHRGMPVTTPARTLVDLGSVSDDGLVERALESALRRKLVTVRELESLLAITRLRGGRVIRRVLSQRPSGAPSTESDAETLFLQLARTCGMPEPRRQYPVVLRGRRYRIDFAWLETRIAVEIDGVATHATPSSLRSDLFRQNRVILDGWMVLRYTWFDIVNQPHDLVVPDLLAAWAMRGALLPAAARPAGHPRNPSPAVS